MQPSPTLRPSGRTLFPRWIRHAWRGLACAGLAALGMAGPAAAQAPACDAAAGPDCLYFPAASYGFSPAEHVASYTDAAGDLREVRFLLRLPLGAPSPMPVVVWSHGGADGKRDPATSMTEWSDTTARAGYLTVSIAHTHREPAARRRLCGAIGIADDAACTNFKYLNWDRPHDIRAVLDAIDSLAAGEYRGQIDTRRIAVGGHSAGSGGALTVAGAERVYGGAPIAAADPRPIAFLAFSPQQPGSEGFFDTRFESPRHSWAGVDRPVLAATGDGDSTCNPGPEPGSCIGDTPFGRRTGFFRMPADGGKYQLYLRDAEAFHTLFELNAARCAELQVDPRRCSEMIRWLSSTGLAFLDAHLRQLPAARQWLQSERITAASGGVAEWLRR